MYFKVARIFNSFIYCILEHLVHIRRLKHICDSSDINTNHSVRTYTVVVVGLASSCLKTSRSALNIALLLFVFYNTEYRVLSILWGLALVFTRNFIDPRDLKLEVIALLLSIQQQLCCSTVPLLYSA